MMLNYEVNVIKENLGKHEECEQLVQKYRVTRKSRSCKNTQSTKKAAPIPSHAYTSHRNKVLDNNPLGVKPPGTH